ncbi:uncharacterized mitochondrial protein AtMg00810-like [Solanum lycopersicum]|uniref:uncharacterized mitochondrial protein AtMg00810-like n=1 Tax=Solanum lycopersicum TaxID=4081 RepID=UPI00374A132B
MATVRSVVSIAAANHWIIHQMDVYNAFLQGDLYEEVYMKLPEGLNRKVGSDQDSFKAIETTLSLFTRRKDNSLVVVLVYVDDLLITGNDSNMIHETKAALQHAFKIKDLGELRYFLGLEFARSDSGILIHQRKYTLELLADMGLSGAKPISTPMEMNLKLTSTEYDDHMDSSHKDTLLEDPASYQRLVGRLLYLTTTRPDISFAVQCLSQFMHAPKVSHMNSALRLVRYLKTEPGLGILMSSTGGDSLQVFCDADWGSCINNRRSITGYLIKYGESLISWRSKKQVTVSRSSAEAEYRAMASTVAEIVWTVGLFQELEVDISLPVSVHSDSTSALQIAANPVFHERTKHIDIDCHFIREKIKDGMLITVYLPSSEQPADMLTKALGKGHHRYLMSKLGMKNIFIAPSLKGGVKELTKYVQVP